MGTIDLLRSHIKQMPVGGKLDDDIMETLVMLWAHGFDTMQSCIGHKDHALELGSRQCYPYINMRASLVKVNEWGKVCHETTDPQLHFLRLQGLVSSFNNESHPFWPKSYRPEMDLMPCVYDSLSRQDVRSRDMSCFTICNLAVRSVRTLPQEMLTEKFKLAFLRRTQDEMRLFTKFLEWRLSN